MRKAKIPREPTTQTGLEVNASLITKHYSTGQKVSDHQMRQIPLKRQAILPQWNYTISSHENRN